MKNLDVRSPAFAVSPASNPDLQLASRLIVLVPEFEADPALVAQKIRSVAESFESRVQLLGLSRDAMHEPGMRRRLATLSAMVEDDAIFVESKVVSGGSWLNAIQPHWHSGDVIVCFAEQSSNFSGKPLHQILQSNLNAMVYVISDVQIREEYSRRPGWVSSILAWAGSIALILGFFWLQMRLVQSTQTMAQTILFYGSLIAEAGSIWMWNDLFN